MHHAFDPPDFDSDFASPADWACMYRALGLQVIPCYMPNEVPLGAPWKRPKLSEWTEYHHKLAPQTTFDRWYGPGGEHIARDNLGIVTGEASGNVFVLDFDDHKGPQADQWWRGLISIENNDIDPETAEQQTGGGGRQKLFRAPVGYHVPTNRTSLGIDIRGQAGFAVMPASLHESGKHYQWSPGCAPWEIAVAMAEQWLLDAVEALAGAYGGDRGGASQVAFGDDQGSTPHEHTASPRSDYDGFGNVQDGREKVMRDVVWHAVLELYRQSPIPPPIEVWLPAAEEAYETYERRVTSRIVGTSKFERLEREHRGVTAFRQKWRATLRHWGSPRMVTEAAKPNPKPKNEPPPQPPPIDPKTGERLPLLLSAEQFIDGFTPPAYLIDGILQRGYLYSLTARTGHGKTAIAMYVAQCVARAENMHGRCVKQGTVLLLAGENPDDIRARFLVLGEAYGFVPEQLKMRFIAGVVNIATRMAEIRAEADAIDDLILVIVDTAAAYFPGDETNSNSQQGAYARLLRELTFLRGKPAVLVNCHPIKNAAQDNLLPMGGSAFLNEVDGNLTLWADAEKQVSLHWLGKFRGPEFEPLAFELRMADSVRVHDAEGRLMPSVVAVPVADLTMEEGRRKQESDENRVLRILGVSPGVSFTQIAVRCGFVHEGRPSKTKVSRIMKSLLEFSLVTQNRNGKYKLTKKGEDEIGLTRAASGAFG